MQGPEQNLVVSVLHETSRCSIFGSQLGWTEQVGIVRLLPKCNLAALVWIADCLRRRRARGSLKRQYFLVAFEIECVCVCVCVRVLGCAAWICEGEEATEMQRSVSWRILARVGARV